MLFHLSLTILIWNSSTTFAEINEEVEQILEDENPSESFVPEHYFGFLSPDVYSYISLFNEDLAKYTSYNYFEIDSPPPELA